MGRSCEAATAAQNSLEAAQSKILFTQQALGFSSPWKNPHTKSPCHVPVDKIPCHQSEFYPAAQTLAPQPSSSVPPTQSHKDQLPLDSKPVLLCSSDVLGRMREALVCWQGQKEGCYDPLWPSGWRKLWKHPLLACATPAASCQVCQPGHISAVQHPYCGIPSSRKAPWMEG